MRKPGTTTKYPREKIQQAVTEYLTTEKTAKEIEQEYKIPAPVITYHARKEKKE